MRSRSSMPSRTSSSLDLVVIMSCDLTLQICLIIALSFHCCCWRFGFVNGQVSLPLSIVLCTHGQELYTRPRVLKEWWREERTGSNSLNIFQVLWLKVPYWLKVRYCDHSPSVVVVVVRLSVRPFTIFKQNLLLNHSLDFDQISQE